MKAIHSIALSLAVAVVALMGSAAAGYYFGRISGLKSNEPIKATTDTVYVAETVRIKAPAPVSTGVLPYQFVQIPVPVFHTDTVEFRDTVYVDLPREVAVYQDSTYRAVVSGIQPRLDTLDFYRNTAYIKPKPKRWGIGPTISGGIGWTAGDGWNTLRPGLYVGIGIHYDLIQF
ncbi:MAG: hypothetical protein IJP93_03095 [Bacteroidales bacterium]|nr:hypothetical protein [Bacteroidales bacterium]